MGRVGLIRVVQMLRGPTLTRPSPIRPSPIRPSTRRSYNLSIKVRGSITLPWTSWKTGLGMAAMLT